MEEVDRIRTRHSDHTYATDSNLLPLHVEYADDVDFICMSDKISSDELLQMVRDVFGKYNLNVNESKTELTQFSKNCDLTNTKKLGSMLDDTADITNRNG